MAKPIVMRSGSTVTAYVNGKQYQVPFEEEEHARQMVEDAKKLIDWPSMLAEFFSDDFMTTEGVLKKNRKGKYFLDGIRRALPQLMVDRIKEREEDELGVDPLINFWRLLMTNENEHVKDDLFSFADRFQFPITDHGYFIAYKSVLWKGQSFKNYAAFISGKFLYHISNGRKPQDYEVFRQGEDEDDGFMLYTPKEWAEIVERNVEFWRDEREWDHVVEYLQDDFDRNQAYERFKYNNPDYTFEAGLALAESLGYQRLTNPEVEALVNETELWHHLGNLEQLYEELIQKFKVSTDGEDVFTDIHSRRMTIKLGTPVEMPMEDCDTNPNNTCSSGLHVGAPGYVKMFGGHQEDRFVLACLVNPADVAAVPYDYNFEKMRTSRYYPYAVCELDEDGKIREVDTKYFEVDFLDYERSKVSERLQELRVKRHEMASRDIEDVELDEVIELLKGRLVDLSMDNPNETGPDFEIKA